MGQILDYNIHNILTIKIMRNSRHNLLGYLNYPFTFFETNEEVSDPDITLNIGRFAPSNDNCYNVEHKYFIKNDYFYCKDSEGSANWELEIFGFEDGPTTINFNGNFFGPESLFSALICQEMLLMPVIIYQMSKKGYYLIHAGGVSRDNYAYVFAGRGGAYKTELVMTFVKAQYDYLGDDWIILHDEKVLPFPKHFSEFIFSFKTGCLPTESSSNIVDKIRYFKYARREPSSDSAIFKVSNLSTLKALCFIINSSKGEGKIQNINLNDSANKLITNNQIEITKNPNIMGKKFGRYFNYMLAYSFIFTESQIASYWDNLSHRLKRILRTIPTYEILLDKFDLDRFHKINKFIEGL